MNFTIYGVNFFNKGAELMLYAAKEQVQEWDKSNTISGHLNIGNFEQRKQAGLHHLAWFAPRASMTRKAIITDFAAKLIPKVIRQQFEIILESEIEVILDASGFAFSDQWEPEKTEIMAKHCLRWRKQGKKIVLLPQAFGPFENERVRAGFKIILENADLIFARDRVSYSFIKELSFSDNVKLAPDFTNLLKGLYPEYIDNLANRPCIIPNQRMLDKTSSEVKSKYMDFLVSAIRNLVNKDYQPFILIHESSDIKLAKNIKDLVGREIQVIKEENPLYLKGILDKCYLVIGSRFHGLVSALSQGTPCLGTGWSHKYQMLFEDYNCPELLINIEEDIDKNLDILNLLLDDFSREDIVMSINEGAKNQKSLSQLMWIEVKKLVHE